MLSFDCETTGLDIFHSARPFFVTICFEDGTQHYWEWDVDPFTRVPEPSFKHPDLQEIRDLLLAPNQEIIGQNIRFDVKMLDTLIPGLAASWDWSRTHDTLIAGHVLASNQPHDLTSMVLQYLGIDISPLEDTLHKACEAARRYCRSHLPEWAIAKQSRDDMPSAKGECWKYDTWLPKALCDHIGVDTLAAHLDRDVSHWPTVLSDYSNADSMTTLALWPAQRQELERRGLWAIYQTRMKLPAIAHRMEHRGITINKDRLDRVAATYREESEEAGKACVNIASSMGHELTLPKSGNNGSLLKFCFDKSGLNLPVVKRSKQTYKPSLDKVAMDEYLATLPEHSKCLLFIKSLYNKRKRDTALSYIEGYQRFWLPLSFSQESNYAYQQEQESTETSALSGSKLLSGQSREVIGQTVERMYESASYKRSQDRRRGMGGPSTTGSPCRGGKEVGRGGGIPTADDSWYVLHPNLNITGTATLRWSSSNPNEQNIAKQEGFSLRYAFGPAPGREWWSLDAENIELRIPAYDAGEQAMIDLFERPNDPPYFGSNHLLCCHIVHPDLFNECKDEHGEVDGRIFKKRYKSTWYQWAKNGNFSIQYGAQRDHADRTYHVRGAYDLIQKKLGKIADLNRRMIAFAEKHGYIETMPDRSVDPNHGYPLLCTRTENGRILPTVPLSYRVQGTACWWMMMAMIRCQNQLDKWRAESGFDGHIALQVHDELVFDLPKGGIHPTQEEKVNSGGFMPNGEWARSNLWRIRILQKMMAQGGEDIGVPTTVGVEFHADNWGEGVTL